MCNSGTIGNPYQACNAIEKKSCTTTTCGRGAQCRETYNSVECACLGGYSGNPYVECRDVDECNNNACGENAVCINTVGSYDCRCKDGYAGNPFIMCASLHGGICSDAKSCACDASVICPDGYSCNNGRCENLCEHTQCGPRATCDDGLCKCPPEYMGDPNDLKTGCALSNHCVNDGDCKDSEICFQFAKGLRKCVDACSKVQCGPNALCVVENHRSSCICANGYRGNPGNLNIGCQPEERVNRGCTTDHDCKDGYICAISEEGYQKCVYACDAVACGLHETCKLDKNYHPVCVCKSDYLWNPVTSSCEKPSIPDCTSNKDCPATAACKPDPLGVLKCVSTCSEFTCPQNAVCVAAAHKGECQCLSGYTGNPNDRNGCGPMFKDECASDAQCSEQETCRKDKKTGVLKCQNACESITCGLHAVCVVNNHVPQCQCPPGPFVGNPTDKDKGCQQVPCVYNIDCPPSQLCNRLTHTCADVCEEDSCGTNAVCIGDDHKSVCQCPVGFKPNPIPEVECVQTEICNPNSCHPSAICEATLTGFTCKCPPNQIGDPYSSGCRPEGNCPNGDSDCPIQSVCQSGKCINPCDHTRCGPNALCSVENRKAICSCPQRFIPSPQGVQGGCLRISTSCTNDFDCENEACFNGQCKPVCRSNDDCVQGEKCLHNMCMVLCADHSQCRNDQACVNGICIIGCRSNKDCSTSYACINNTCQNPCNSKEVCGPNALCSVVEHQTICRCPDGFEGNPTPEEGCVRYPITCLSTNECPSAHMCIANKCNLPCSDNNVCAIGERCHDNVCVKLCLGNSNCLPGEICLNGICQQGCSVDSDCQNTQICIRNKCRCSTGYIGSPHGCLDIDECEDHPCHPTAKCLNSPGTYRCICPEGTVGDPFIEPGCILPNQCNTNQDCAENLSCMKGKCVDECLTKTCGPNAVCNNYNHVATCTCLTGYLGDANDLQLGCFKVECIDNEDCAVDKVCHLEANKCVSK